MKLKFKTFLAVILGAGVIQLVGGCASSTAALEARAKVSKESARQTALARVAQGRVVEGEIEEENGRLIWSFDIATPGSKDITEVHVDATTGAIVDVETETPADQKREKEEKSGEKKEKH